MSGLGRLVGGGLAALAGTAALAGMSAAGAIASKSAARKAAQAQLAGNLSATNQLVGSAKSANKQLAPYAGLGTGAANILQQNILGSPEQVFAPTITIPDYPERKAFKSDQKFKKAVKDWKANYTNIRDQAAAQGIELPELGKFQTTVAVNDGKGGITNQTSFSAGQLKSFLRDWNGQQAARAKEQSDLAAQGINADNYTGAMMDKGDMSKAGMLTHNYTTDDYERQFGPGAKATWQMDQSDFQASPDYQWRLNQGMNSLQSSAAAKGGLLSSATLKALNDYGQNQASGEFQNWWNRKSSDYQNWMNGYIANSQNWRAGQNQALGAYQTALNSGQNAANKKADNILGTSNSIAGIMSGQGAVNAESQLAQGAAQSNMLQGIGSAISKGLGQAATLYGMYSNPGAGAGAGGTSSPNSNGLQLPDNTPGVNLAGPQGQAYMNSLFKPTNG